MTIQAVFEFTKEDYKEIVKYHLRSQRARRVAFYVDILLVGVLGACGIYFLVDGDIGWVIFCFAFCVALVAAKALRGRLMVRSLQRTPFYRGRISVMADGSGTKFTYPTGDSNTLWPGYIRYFETPHLFVLYLSNSHFRAVPKRALAQEQLLQFRELLRQRIPAPAGGTGGG